MLSTSVSIQKRSQEGQRSALCVSLHFQHRSGLLVSAGKPGSYTWRALRIARAVIRNQGFTIRQAYTAAHGHWHAESLPAGFSSVAQLQAGRKAWQQAQTAAAATWNNAAPEGCPRCPEIMLTVAIRQRPAIKAPSTKQKFWAP